MGKTTESEGTLMEKFPANSASGSLGECELL